MKIIVSTILLIFMINVLTAQEFIKIKLNSPQLEKGKPLMQVLKERKSSREYSDKKLSIQELSNLLWAANGINREDGKRTAPTAMNTQEIDIYVILEEGIYLYEPVNNELLPIVSGDFRKSAGKQDFVETAPVNLVFVADLAKISFQNNESDKISWANIDVGFVSQNVYLYCASEGLATVVRGYVDKDALSKVMKLRSDQKVILAQTVGYPKTK